MDKFDKQLLTILRNDARSSVTDMAKAVNLSRSAVTARIKKLESDGVILGAIIAKRMPRKFILSMG